MKWSFRFARVFGIDLKVHVTFLFVLALWASQGAARGVGGMLLSVATILSLFACVLLHELGHSVAAIRFGIPVREIILLPIGGVAMLSKSPGKARHELLIAAAGPAVNVVILAVLVPVLLFVTGGGAGLQQLVHQFGRGQAAAAAGPGTVLLFHLVAANVMLILFNLIPAFPLDGGRMLRALLWMRLPLPRATRIAATIGQVFALAFGVWALVTGNWMLGFIALFVFLGAGAETAAAQSGTVLATRRVGDAYNKFALSLSLDDRVSRVIDYILTSYQPDFAVLHRGKLQGVVTRDDVLRWLSANDYDVYVTEIMHEDVLRVDAKQSLDDVIEQLQAADRRVAAVFDGDTYLGLVSAEDIAEAQLVLTFMRRGPTAGPATSRRIRPAEATADPIV